MPNLRPILHIFGVLLTALGALMFLPALVDLADRDPDWGVFTASGIVTSFTGVTLVLSSRGRHGNLTIRQAFLLTATSWVGLAAFGALPLLFSNLKIDFSDAYFETVSGLTTTGSTVLTGIDFLPRGILLWRSLLQWLGGIGIILMAVAILPYLRVGGMQLFRTESSDRSEKVLPRSAQIATSVGLSYLALSLLCFASYVAGGMSAFDAANHAMTTVSTGGFSTSDASLGNFPSPAIQWTCILFMVAGALPFVLYIQLMQGALPQVLRNPQLQGFILFLLLAVAAVAVPLGGMTEGTVEETVRTAAFNVVSIVTTTGFASADYGQWAGLASIFFLLTFVGGCTGSTSGGIKIFRFQVLAVMLRNLMRRTLRPHGIFPDVYERRSLPEGVTLSVMAFCFCYFASVAVLTVLLAALGLDFTTSLTGAATALGNVGPGLGPVIGPAGNFSSLPDAAKWLLSFGMLLGRLELFTLLVLVSPAFWRD